MIKEYVAMRLRNTYFRLIRSNALEKLKLFSKLFVISAILNIRRKVTKFEKLYVFLRLDYFNYYIYIDVPCFEIRF